MKIIEALTNPQERSCLVDALLDEYSNSQQDKDFLRELVYTLSTLSETAPGPVSAHVWKLAEIALVGAYARTFSDYKSLSLHTH